MAPSRRIVVIGAGGVFGRLLAAELDARGDVEVVRAGRPAVDMRDPPSVRRVAADAFAVACAAGPFQDFDRNIVHQVVREGAHWLDIADDPRWFFGLVDDGDLDRAARDRGVVVVPGLSTFPAISGALVRRAMKAATVSPLPLAGEGGRRPGEGPPDARITLHIGNRNAKGAASIASALASDGRGLITPDAELLRRELGITATAHVEFQLPGATAAMRVLGGIRSAGTRARIGRALSALAAPLNRLGSDRSVLRVEIDGHGHEVRGRGQRMAILPQAFVLDRLLAGTITARGAMSPAQAVESERLLEFVEAAA
jgi:hypothetical protein